jgi:hypothetical protein
MKSESGKTLVLLVALSLIAVTLSGCSLIVGSGPKDGSDADADERTIDAREEESDDIAVADRDGVDMDEVDLRPDGDGPPDVHIDDAAHEETVDVQDLEEPIDEKNDETDVQDSTDTTVEPDAMELCGERACGPHEECCSETCVNVETDTIHCGRCDSPCNTNESCSGGACVCGTDPGCGTGGQCCPRADAGKPAGCVKMNCAASCWCGGCDPASNWCTLMCVMGVCSDGG